MDEMTTWVEWDGTPWKVSGAGGDIMVDLGDGVLVAECLIGYVTVWLEDGRVVTNRGDVVFEETGQ